MQNILLECARRDLSNGGVYGVAWVPWHGAQQIFARPSPASWAQRGQISALGLPGAPLIARRCSAITPDHSATIGGHVGSAAVDLAWAPPEPLPLGPAAAANAPLPGMPSAPGRALCAAITAAHTFTIAELFVRLGTALAAAGGRRRSSAGVQQSPAGLQEDVRPQVHQLASSGALERAPQMHMSSADTPAPSAVILAKSSAHKGIGPLFSSLLDLLSQLNLSR